MVDTDINYTAEKNVTIWSDRDYRLSDLPIYLNGAKVVNISSNRLNQEEKIGLLVHERYIGDKLNEILIKDGWIRLPDEGTLVVSLETSIWRHGTEDVYTILKLPPKNIYSILFRGNNQFSYFSCL